MTKKTFQPYEQDPTDARKLLELERPRARQPKHRQAVDCWCEPELKYVDPKTGDRVYTHREIH